MSKSFESPSNRPNPVVDFITQHRDRLLKFAKQRLETLGAEWQAGAVDEMADDLVQEVNIKVLAYMEKFPDRPILDPESFFKAAIFNMGFSMMKKVWSEKTKPSGLVDAAEVTTSRSPLNMEEPENPEDEIMAAEIWKAILWGEKEINGKTFKEYVNQKEFDRNIEIVRGKAHNMSSYEILKRLQEMGYMKEYDISNEKDVKKAGLNIDQIYLRMIKSAKKWLESLEW